MSKIILRNLFKNFTTTQGELVSVLEGINLEVADGEFVCLVGKSGCGKTTLLRIIAGLEQPSAGEILIDNNLVKKPDPLIGMVFQEDRLFPWRTVRRNVEFGLELRKMAKHYRQQAVEKYLRLVGLESFADALPYELSGGMKQRAAIARALVNEPDVILMDEPFGALDAQTRNQMQEELLEIWVHRSRTVLFVTHSVDEAVMLADRVLVLAPHPGRIQCEYRLSMPRPRDRLSNEFIKSRREILEALNKAR
ncbi:MAG: ABC transporter ATP-binding protein [Desulfosporosinus sp.]|nr:ABC transporter ATP-binding protein [Desulfosporosinus sp.]